MEHLFTIINSNIQYAPLIIFGSLLLAGFNLPVSEDAMLFISAVLAAKKPDMLPQFFIGVFAGAYLSDLIAYGLGRILGDHIWRIPLFSRLLHPERIKKISEYYKKYGMITLIVGRFIPFGVRNGLFLSAGLGKMHFLRFSLYDLLACTISSVTFFSLYYKYGNSVVDYVRRGNIILFSVAAIAVIAFFVVRKIRKSSVKQD